jgi:hypothetical protein
MPSRSIRSVTAAWLVMLLGVLHTGVPSHSHATDQSGDAGAGQVLRAADHAHGTQLVDQAERVQSTGIQLAAVPWTVDREVLRAPARMHAAVHNTPLRPLGRAPPPRNASRAPPRHI